MAIMMRCRIPPDSSCGYCRIRRLASGMRTSSSVSIARCAACSRLMALCTRKVSMIWSPTRMWGVSEVSGSWKIMVIFEPRMWFSRDSEAPISSWPR